MFLNTLGLKEQMIRNWLEKKQKFGLQISPTVKRIKHLRNVRNTDRVKNLQERKTHMELFLRSFPKLESHYCRKDTTKLYFQTTHKTKKDVYNDYVQICTEEKREELSWPVFHAMLLNLNYCTHKPRKDQCDTCSQYKVSNLGQAEFDVHRSNVELARTEKANDVEVAKTGEFVMLCMDVQAVQLCPKVNASSTYYKMKLQIHNFTIFDIVTHESSNYVWDETAGELTANIFTTIIINHLERIITDKRRPIDLYSDG